MVVRDRVVQGWMDGWWWWSGVTDDTLGRNVKQCGRPGGR